MAEPGCPSVDGCLVPVSRKEFDEYCCGDWRRCPVNALKVPSKWKEELKGELYEPTIVVRGIQAGRVR